MGETRTVRDPFLGKDVQISDRLVDRLRGKYASGPHLPNGNPEFGWRQFQAPPIQHEAAAEIERLRNNHAALVDALREFIDILDGAQSGFIPGCGSDLAWTEGRDKRLAEAKKLLSAVGGESGD